jgi:hypothetical protein
VNGVHGRGHRVSAGRRCLLCSSQLEMLGDSVRYIDCSGNIKTPKINAS